MLGSRLLPQEFRKLHCRAVCSDSFQALQHFPVFAVHRSRLSDLPGACSSSSDHFLVSCLSTLIAAFLTQQVQLDSLTGPCCRCKSLTNFLITFLVFFDFFIFLVAKTDVHNDIGLVVPSSLTCEYITFFDTYLVETQVVVIVVFILFPRRSELFTSRILLSARCSLSFLILFSFLQAAHDSRCSVRMLSGYCRAHPALWVDFIKWYSLYILSNIRLLECARLLFLSFHLSNNVF